MFVEFSVERQWNNSHSMIHSIRPLNQCGCPFVAIFMERRMHHGINIRFHVHLTLNLAKLLVFFFFFFIVIFSEENNKCTQFIWEHLKTSGRLRQERRAIVIKFLTCLVSNRLVCLYWIQTWIFAMHVFAAEKYVDNRAPMGKSMNENQFVFYVFGVIYWL